MQIKVIVSTQLCSRPHRPPLTCTARAFSIKSLTLPATLLAPDSSRTFTWGLGRGGGGGEGQAGQHNSGPAQGSKKGRVERERAAQSRPQLGSIRGDTRPHSTRS